MSRDSELQVFAFRSKKWIDRSSYAVDIAKSEGENLIWKSDGPSRQILAQNPTTRPIGLSNRKMASVFNQVEI